MSLNLFDPSSGAGGRLGAAAALGRILDAASVRRDDDSAELRTGRETRAVLCLDSLAAGDGEVSSAFDLVITNPPFSGNVDDETTAKRAGDIKTKKTELLFLLQIISSLRPGGRASVLVPGGVLFGSGKAHLELRRRLVEENNLEAVVHVPAGAFKPYAGSATSIVLLTAGAPVTERVWFDEITALGYSLDNRRRPIAQDDVPAVLERWRGRRGYDGARTGSGFFVPVEELRENDYVLQIGRYREFVMEEPSAGKSVEELLLDIVRIDLEVTNHMKGLASMLGLSYDEMMRRAMERPLPSADDAAGRG
ncbi:MAG: class I SAM-dependent DNA methyltransferase [Pyrinomonadaceae bacterium]